MSDPEPDYSCHVCPWWLAYAFDNPLRRLLHNPSRLFAGLVQAGDTVLDLGCGRGFFSLGLARLVGPAGRVYAADLQPQLLHSVSRRARRRRLQEIIVLHQCQPDNTGLRQTFDFILLFWMLHEAPDLPTLVAEVTHLLVPDGRLLLVEPRLHVSAREFTRSLDLFTAAGLALAGTPPVRLSRAALFRKEQA